MAASSIVTRGLRTRVLDSLLQGSWKENPRDAIFCFAARSFCWCERAQVPSPGGAFKCSVLGDMGLNRSAATVAQMLQHTDHLFVPRRGARAPRGAAACVRMRMCSHALVFACACVRMRRLAFDSSFVRVVPLAFDCSARSSRPVGV